MVEIKSIKKPANLSVDNILNTILLGDSLKIMRSFPDKRMCIRNGSPYKR